MLKKLGVLAALAASCSFSQGALAQNRTAFVHLFEWSWNDIAIECEQHLGPKGFAAVQVSPPQKSVVRSEWWSRYQPLSYEITGRGGTRAEFQSMVNRCNAVGVEIYADAVINHMAALDRNFPEVPYGTDDFHNCRTPINYNDRFSVQNCDLVGLNDLKTEKEYVRQQIANYMNDLISLGVSGFRIDAAKHMPSGDIAAILAKLSQDVYIFQEVIGAPGEAVQPPEYLQNGDITEFNMERTLGFYFKGRGPLKDLRGIRDFDGWLQSDVAVTFVANHDDQRQKTDNTLTYKDSNAIYELGEIFSLAYPYGYPKVMSSYFFEDENQGPPANGVHSGDGCGINWVCEHRWQGVANMVEFRNVTSSAFELSNWWDNGSNQIAFGRGDRGFVVINRQDGQQLNRTLQTGLPAGSYCDIVNGEYDKVNETCSGPVISVNADGTAQFNVASIQAAAIHVGAIVDVDPSGPVWANAYFRGTPNAWGTTAMTFSDGLWRTTQTFGGSNPRFKIARFQNWSESYPNQDFLVTEPGTYDITINDRTQQITATKQSSGGDTVTISFECRNGFTQFGQSVYVVGNQPELGNWSQADAVVLNSADYPTWKGQIDVAKDQAVQWKCLKRSETNPNQNVQWEGGANSQFTSDTDKTTVGQF